MGDNEKFKWISQTVYSYQDPETSAQFCINMESGAGDENGMVSPIPSRLSFLIRDPRINRGQKVQFELGYIEAFTLFKKIDMQIAGNFNNLYSKAANIEIVKYLRKSKKQLVLNFSMSKVTGDVNQQMKSVSKLWIIDSAGTATSGNMQLDKSTVISIYEICKQFSQNYLLITTNMLNVCSIERMIHETRILGQTFNTRNMNVVGFSQEEEITEPLPPIGTIKESASVDKSIVDVDISDDGYSSQTTDIIPSQYTDFSSDLSDELVEEIKVDSGNFEIGDVEVLPKENKSLTPLPLIGNFLNYDVFNMKKWVTAFMMGNANTQERTFCPFDTIMSQTCPNDEVVEFIQNPEFYKAQAYLMLLQKKSIEEYIKTGNFSKTSIYKFHKSIQPGTTLWNVACEIGVLIISHTAFYTKYLKNVNVDNKNERLISEYRITEDFLKKIMSSFLVSVDASNLQKLSDDTKTVFRKAIDSNFFKKMETDYFDLSFGGQFSFSQKMIDEMTDNFILNVVPRIPIIVDGFSDSTDYKEQLLVVNNCTSVKQFIIFNLGSQSSNDLRLKAFIEAAKSELQLSDVSEINAMCNTFDDLLPLFQKKSFPLHVVKVKRVMDMDKNLNRRSDILKAVKELNEDPTVTETRVIASDPSIFNTKSTNIDFDAELDAVLFGE